MRQSTKLGGWLFPGRRSPVVGLWLFVVVLAASLPGCTDDPGTGPVDVKWDRTTCERCRMVLSDHKHAAQVRMPSQDGRSKVFAFDDFGCAIVWLEDKPWRDDPRTEIWVDDWRTGAWIDARRASYVLGQVTPMEYGLGAQSDSHPEGLSFSRARERVLELEARNKLHGEHATTESTER